MIDITTIPSQAFRNFQTVIGPYFTGGTKTIQGNEYAIPQCNFLYDLRLIDPNAGTPQIIIIGSGVRDYTREKSERILNSINTFGYEIRAQVARTVFVQCGLSTGNLNGGNNEGSNSLLNSIRTADQVYGYLVAAVLANGQKFSSMDLYNVQLSPIPSQIGSLSYAMTQGQLTMEVRVFSVPEVYAP